MEGESSHKRQPSDSNSKGKAEMMHEPDQKCPRCGSMDTRFCYYNNNKTYQPRYICKGCKRFWTLGGVVRKSRSKGHGSVDLEPSTIVSAGGIVRTSGSLNFTRPQLVANQPHFEFVQVDLNSLSLATTTLSNRHTSN